MIKQFKNYLAILCIALLAISSSCDTEEAKIKGEFSSGVLIINEGGYRKSNSSVAFYNPSTGEVQADLFGAKNDGRQLGDVTQSLTVDDEFAFVIVNNDNRIEVVNANTFVSEYAVNVFQPRYLSTYKGKAYVTGWGKSKWPLPSLPGKVSVIDLVTHTIEDTISTGINPENIIESNGKLYVSNKGNKTVSVIDPNINEVIATIDVASSPGAFVVDSENKLWLVCGGGVDENYDPLNDGALLRIDVKTNTVDKILSLNKNVAIKLLINKQRNTLFFHSGTKIYSVATSATTAPAEPIVNEDTATDFYGIGYDAVEDVLYAADPLTYISNGVVYRYKSDGTKIDNFTSAGIAPNGFVFRK